MAKKRKKKNGENAVREWISDNLRYLLLILIVVIAALAAFLIYREVSDRRSAAANAPVEQTAAEPAATPAATETPAPEETASSSSSSEEQTTTAVVTVTPNPDAALPGSDVTLSEMNPSATVAVENYFYNLQGGGNDYIEYYDSIHVQSCPGPEEGTYIAYADYECKYLNYDAMVPGLMEFYLAPDENGELQDVADVPADVKAYIANVRQTEDVQELIIDVDTRYQEVMDANPELEAYIAGLE